ncbi:hypothetical protein ACFVR6_02995 [Microbacterium sp. NPDC058021]|uniref:hypothetical protein n=1 Tax=Microbacterium sp. NPDC058021 TaxID=3346306 RepID=UPI0036D85244
MSVMIDTAPSTEVRSAAAWFEVEQGFWVANTGGQYLGAVERERWGGFCALDETGARIGWFPSLAAARDAVVSEDR